MKSISQQLSGPATKKRGDSGRTEDFANKSNFSNQSGREMNQQSSTLKSKLSLLEVNKNLFKKCISEVYDDLTKHEQSVNSVSNEKDRLQQELKEKTIDVKNSLIQELVGVEEEMLKHFNNQKSDNIKLEQQLNQLKTEKTVLQNQLIALQRRITDLEMHIGNENVKFN